MQIHYLSSNERVVIKRIAQLQIESFTRVAKNGDPMIDELRQEYLEDGIPGFEMDLMEQLTIDALEFERVFEEPEYLFLLDEYNLAAALFIVSEGVSEEKFPKTKKSLLFKLEQARQNLNQLN